MQIKLLDLWMLINNANNFRTRNQNDIIVSKEHVIAILILF